MRDWVYAWRIHHGYPVELPECREERLLIVEDLTTIYGWGGWRAADAAGAYTAYRALVAS